MIRAISILILFVWSLNNIQAQIKPNDFPEKTTPEDTDEIYSQYNDNHVRIKFATAKSYFSPDVELTPILYIPTLTNNTQNKGEFVTDPNDDIWYIDNSGRAIKFASNSTSSDTQSIILVNDLLILDRQGLDPDTVDLSDLDTDDQTLTWIDGSNTLSIVDGNNVVITGFLESEVDGDVSNELDTLTLETVVISNGGDTAAYEIISTLNGNELERDTLFLPVPTVDTDTDDQTIDIFSYAAGIITLSLEDDGQSALTIDISGIDTDTDDQTLTWIDGSNTLSIVDGNNVVITGFLESEVDGSTTNETGYYDTYHNSKSYRGAIQSPMNLSLC